ncbi:MAG: flagellin [Burkholderiaceae bacterium]
MPQVINTNLASLNAQRNLSSTNNQMALALQRLSSGLRVNSAKDDAAGLAIAERMNSQVRGMNVAMRNANDGISMAQVAEGALGKISDMLQRMRELAVQSANATNSDGDRANLDAEFQQLSQEVQRMLNGTRFNGADILAGGAGSQTFQVGAGTTADDTFTITSGNLAGQAEVAAVTGGDLTSAANATTSMDNIDTLLDVINNERAVWGATQNRFEAIIANLQVASENQAAARSRIMDADFAAETAALTRAQVLQQAGNAMLAQANQLPSTVLQLLGG